MFCFYGLSLRPLGSGFVNPAHEIVDNQYEVIQRQNEIMQNELVRPEQEIVENQHRFPAKSARMVEVEEQILIKRRRVVEF